MNSEKLRHLRFVSDQFRSGDTRRIDEVIKVLMQNPDPELISGLLSGAYVDYAGVLWVPPDFAVNRSKQPVVDYGFWQLIALAPYDVCMLAGIDKHQINIVKFRSYSEKINHPEDVPVCYGENLTRMDKFPEAICHLPSLKKIDARDTAFTFIPESIGSCSSLTSFTLAFFTGQSLPASVREIETLEELQIFHSTFDQWPDHIAGISNLKFLKISSCKFKSMPVEIRLPVSAEVLHLDKLNMSAVPDSVFRCCNLKELSLFGNSIKTLPDKFDQLPALKKINLRENPIAGDYEKLKFINHLNVSSNERNYFRSVPAESSFESSFSVGRIDTFLDFEEKKDNPYPYKYPGLPPEDLAAAVNMISGMLSTPNSMITGDYNVFSAGMQLLSSFGADARFTEYCLAAIPIEENGYITISELKIRHLKLLFDFLIENPERALCTEGSWRYALRHATIPVNTGQFNKVIEVFPNLSVLRLNLSFAPDELTQIELTGQLRPVCLTNFRGSSLDFNGTVFNAQEIVIQNCTINSCLKINNLNGLERIIIHNSAVSRVEISGCAQLKYIEYERKENNDFRVMNATIAHCPALTQIRLRQVRLSGLTLTELPSLEKLHINGRCTNTRKFTASGCNNLKEIEMVSCYLSEIPSFIHQISGLVLLRLKKCNLNTIGEELGNLKNLRMLDLSGNVLTSVPESVFDLSSLEILHLGYQGKNLPTKSLIQNLPDGLNALKHLKYIAVMMPELKLRKIATRFRGIRLSLTNCIIR